MPLTIASAALVVIEVGVPLLGSTIAISFWMLL